MAHIGLGRKELYRIMKKYFLRWLAASAVIMLLLPCLAVTLVPGDAGMAVCFLLFYVVDPAFSLVAGFSAGRNWKQLWILPVLSALLFLAGTGIFFDMGEPAFLLYTGIYLALGSAAMAFSGSLHTVARKKSV